jgi:hypothetical protein
VADLVEIQYHVMHPFHSFRDIICIEKDNKHPVIHEFMCIMQRTHSNQKPAEFYICIVHNLLKPIAEIGSVTISAIKPWLLLAPVANSFTLRLGPFVRKSLLSL